MKFLATISTLLFSPEPISQASQTHLPRERVATLAPKQPTKRAVSKRGERTPQQPKPEVLSERELIQKESEIGATLFGEIPAGHTRQFFNLDPATWIWYDEWVEGGVRKPKSMTIRYEVHRNGILKVQEGARYSFIEGQELENFKSAVQRYYEAVSRQLYHQEPTFVI